MTDRAAFEAWALRELKQDARNWKHPSGEYVYLESEWKAWQEAAKQMSSAKDAEIAHIREVRNASAEEWRMEVRLCRDEIASLRDALLVIRNHTSVSANQIEMLDEALTPSTLAPHP